MRWRILLMTGLLMTGVVAATVLGPARQAHAAACPRLLADFKRSADNATRDVSRAAEDRQRAIQRSADQDRRTRLMAQFCAATAEASGILKSYRTVMQACVPENAAERNAGLDALNHTISQIRASLDRDCR